MLFKQLLKLIPIKLVIQLSWSHIYPKLLAKAISSSSSIDEKVLEELDNLIQKLTE